jgi:hypothetical protein
MMFGTIGAFIDFHAWLEWPNQDQRLFERLVDTIR